MKKNRYISSVLLLLFVVAFACRLTAGLMCCCDELLPTQVHHCCSCSDHAPQCLNHTQSLKSPNCQMHNLDSSGKYIYVSSFESNNRALNELACVALTLAWFSLSNLIDLDSVINSLRREIVYLFSSSQWSPISSSLKSPPVH